MGCESGRGNDENGRWEVRVKGRLNGRCKGVRKVGKNRVERRKMTWAGGKCDRCADMSKKMVR